jgi:WD40 repeat protein
VWDIGYDEDIDHLQAHKGEVACLHYNAEFPSKVMSGGAYPDDTIKIWDRSFTAPHPRVISGRMSALS